MVVKDEHMILYYANIKTIKKKKNCSTIASYELSLSISTSSFSDLEPIPVYGG